MKLTRPRSRTIDAAPLSRAWSRASSRAGAVAKLRSPWVRITQASSTWATSISSGGGMGIGDLLAAIAIEEVKRRCLVRRLARDQAPGQMPSATESTERGRSLGIAPRAPLGTVTLRVLTGAGFGAGANLLLLEEVCWAQHEDLADHVRILLVSAHEPDHRASGGVLDDRLETLSHDLLKRHPLVDDRTAAVAVKERLLDPCESAAQHADHQVVVVVGLGLGRADAVVLLEQRDHPVR